MASDFKVRRTTERKFNPHRLMLRAAEHHLEAATATESGRDFAVLAAAMFSGLAIEAMANTYGDVLIENWLEDFESCKPRVKLRLVSEKCGIKPDYGVEPWQTAGQLIDLRNKIAHPKPKQFKHEVIHLYSDNSHRFQQQEDAIEKIDLAFATKAVAAVKKLQELFNAKLNEHQRHQVSFDGQLFSLSVVDEGK